MNQRITVGYLSAFWQRCAAKDFPAKLDDVLIKEPVHLTLEQKRERMRRLMLTMARPGELFELGKNGKAKRLN